MGPSTPQQGFASPLTHGMPSLLKRTNGFFGAAASPNEPNMQYVRLKKEGIGMWIKGQVTEAFPPEDGGNNHPWKIVGLAGIGQPNANGDYSSYEFQVYPGTINNILPSNTFSDGIEFVKFTISSGSMKYLILDVATDGKKINTATLKLESSVPTNAPPVAENVAPSKIVIPLAIIKGATAVQLRSSAIAATPVVAGTISKVPQNPNDEPFTRTWMWKVESK